MPEPVFANDPIFTAGIEEGKQRTSMMVLTFLEKKYMDRSIARDSEEAKAILKIASETAEFIREQVK